MTGRRLPALLAVVLVLVGLVLLGTGEHGRERPTFGRADAVLMPQADSAGALGSTWYCAAGTATGDGIANLTVVAANVGSEERVGTITWIPTGGGERTVVPLTVPPDGTTAVAATASLTAPIVSALVELDGGEVAVEHSVSGPRGSSVAPCASEASTAWYLANGTTERDSTQVLALFNPFPDDTVVDIAVASEQGRDEPQRVQGLPIAAGTTTFVDLGEVVRYRAATSVSVVARTGRLVVDRLQSFDGSAGRSGTSLALAAPVPAATWHFADGLHGPAAAQAWHVYNPGQVEAVVSLEITPVTGEPPQPLDITIPPRSRQTVDAAESGRIPPLISHSSTITSLNGVPVVAERALDYRRPNQRRGWSSAFGAPDTARRWIFPIGEANVNTDQWIVVLNPGSGDVEVTVELLAGGGRQAVDLDERTVPGRGRLALRLRDFFDRTPLPLVVEATGPVVVERDAYAIGRSGISTVMGVRAP